MPDEWQEPANRRDRGDTTWRRDGDTTKRRSFQREWYRDQWNAVLDHSGWPKESGRTDIEMD
eukprot:scaffold3834_cov89-Cylindrotheca_fusiformis.AAC.4